MDQLPWAWIIIAGLATLATLVSLIAVPMAGIMFRKPGILRLLESLPVYRIMVPRLIRLLKPTERALVEMVENGATLYWRLVVARYVYESNLCDSRLGRLLVENGFYEVVAGLAVKGCDIGYDILWEAFSTSLLSGHTKYSTILEKMLGIELPRAKVVYAYCGRSRRAVKIGDSLFDTSLLSPGGAARALLVSNNEWLTRLRALLAPSIIVGWKCGDSQDIDAVLLARVFFPDVEPDIGSLGYHLDSTLDSPVIVVEKLARVSSWLFNEMPEGSKPPRELGNLTQIPPLELPSNSGASSVPCITLTDKPRMGMPLIKPYRVEPDSPPTSLAWVAVHSLKLRSGDPARAYYYNKGRDELGNQISRAIISSLKKGASTRCGQLEPWDAPFIGVDGNATSEPVNVECSSIIVDCLFIGPGYSRYEIQMVKDGILPGKELKETAYSALIDDPRGALSYRESPLFRKAHAKAPASSKSLEPLGLKVRAPSFPKIHVNKSAEDSKSFWDLASSALPFLEGSPRRSGGAERRLIVVPYRSLSEALSRALNAKNLDSTPLEEWIEDGGLAVSSLDSILVKPEIAHVSSSLVLVSPEGMVKRVIPPTIVGSLPIEDLLELLRGSIKEITAKYGGAASSIALSRLGDGVDVRDYGSTRIDHVELKPDLIIKDLEKDFKRLWGASKSLRRHQIVSLKLLAKSYARMEPNTYTIVLPTGSGKSAIFQLFSRWATASGFGAYSLVVSPLKALIRDQVEKSRKRGLIVSKVDSSTTLREKRQIVEAASLGLLDMLYVTPERFQDESMDDLLKKTPGLIVLDEAHTLFSWGNTFRPSYLYAAKRIREKRLAEGWPPIALFTATGTQDVVRGLFYLLGEQGYTKVNAMDANVADKVDAGGVFIEGPIVREELKFEVMPAGYGPSRVNDLLRVVSSLAKWADGLGEPWVGIVFTGYVRSSRAAWANAETLAKTIGSSLRLRTVYYHGQMPPHARKTVENLAYSAAKGELDHLVIVATKAFGMGVDIPNVRWIVHYMPSDTPEDFYQEAGRAGRDGRTARVVVLYNPKDIGERRRLARLNRIRPSTILKVYNTIIELHRVLKRRGYKGTLVPLPLDALYGKTKALKALDILRRLGLVDYRVSRLGMALYESTSIPESSRWALKLKGRRILSHQGITSENARFLGEIRVLTCENQDATPLRPLRYMVNGETLLSIGDCDGELVEHKGTPIALVYIADEGGTRGPLNYFDQKTLFTILRESSIEEAKLDYLESMLEKALAASIRSGPSTPDTIIKSMLESYFKEHMIGQRQFDKLPTGITQCSKNDCIKIVLEVASKAVSLFGTHYVTIAIRDEHLRETLEDAVLSKLGRVNIGKQSYRKVRASIRSGVYKLMDHGYVILVLSKNSRNTSKIVERLGTYPNLYIILSS